MGTSKGQETFTPLDTQGTKNAPNDVEALSCAGNALICGLTVRIGAWCVHVQQGDLRCIAATDFMDTAILVPISLLLPS